jgi:AraC-like DNA-binding protein
VQTEYTLDHIARLCGYENGFYFSRVFTHYSKVNPSQYRKMYGVGSP